MQRVIFLILALTTLLSNAQQIRVTYKEKRKAQYSYLRSDVGDENMELIAGSNPDMKSEFSSFEYESVLRINDNRSIYFPQENILNDTLRVQVAYDDIDTKHIPSYRNIYDDVDTLPKKLYRNIEVSNKNFSIIYQDLKAKEKISTDRYSGKDYLINEVLEKYNWKITDAKKKIGKYTCQKAILEHQHDESEIHVMGHEHIDLTEVWFTKDIATNHGPSGYWGLPGLVLEVNEGSTHIVVDKIDLDLDFSEIQPPIKGEKITRESFINLPILEFMKN